MKPENEEILQRLMHYYGSSRDTTWKYVHSDEIEKQAENRKYVEDNLRSFETVSRDKIKPAMESIKSKLEQGGHDCAIEEHGGRRDHYYKISMKLLLAGQNESCEIIFLLDGESGGEITGSPPSRNYGKKELPNMH